jgi:hypothetical protein
MIKEEFKKGFLEERKKKCDICRMKLLFKEIKSFMNQYYFEIFNFYFSKPINEIILD